MRQVDAFLAAEGLADTSAISSIVGSRWESGGVFEADKLHRVEKLSDPKRTLADMIVSGRRRKRAARSTRDYLALLAERISLRELDSVPSYGAWRSETQDALADLGITK